MDLIFTLQTNLSKQKCRIEYLSKQLRQIKQELTSEIADPGNETAELLNTKKKLLSWLKNTPVYLALQWFDAVEEVKVSTKLFSGGGPWRSQHVTGCFWKNSGGES